MKKHITELRKLDAFVEDHLGEVSQKTIDIVQDTLQQFDRDWEEDPIQRDEVGAISYDVDILLEIWDKSLEADIAVMERFKRILQEWYDDVDFVNRVLGIPPDKG